MTVVVGRLRLVPANSRLTMGIDELLPLGDNAEIIETVHARRAPMIPVTGSPRL